MTEHHPVHDMNRIVCGFGYSQNVYNKALIWTAAFIVKLNEKQENKNQKLSIVHEHSAMCWTVPKESESTTKWITYVHT